MAQTRKTLESLYLNTQMQDFNGGAPLVTPFEASTRGATQNVVIEKFTKGAKGPWWAEGHYVGTTDGVKIPVLSLTPRLTDDEITEAKQALNKRILESQADRAAISLVRKATEAVERLQSLANNQKGYLATLMANTGNEPSLAEVTQLYERMMNDILWGVANMNLAGGIGTAFEGAKAEGQLKQINADNA